MAHPHSTETESTEAIPRPAREIHALEQRIATLERQVRFLMARLTEDELERFERVES